MDKPKSSYAAVPDSMAIMPSLIGGRRVSTYPHMDLLPEYFFSEHEPEPEKTVQPKIKITNAKPQTLEAFQSELVKCCLSHLSDSYIIHLNRLRGLELLNMMSTLFGVEEFNEAVVTHVIWACISCIHHFLIRLKIRKSVMQLWITKQIQQAFATYSNVVSFLTPIHYNVIFYALMVFFEEGNLWEIEYLASNLLRRLFLLTDEKSRTNSILDIFFFIENLTLSNFLVSRHALRVLYNILEMKDWSWVDDKLLKTFLHTYYKSLTPEGSQEYNYEYLEIGLEICLRAMVLHFDEEKLLNMIIWMLEVICVEKISNDNLLIFGSVLEHITNAYCKTKYHCIFPDKIPPLILKIIASKNLIYSLLGHRILHYLTDRNNNKLIFHSPRIFLKKSVYKLQIANCKECDKILFQKYRHKFHNTFFEGIQAHGTQSNYLENVYISMCLFMVGIPCAYTAAAGVNFAMALQGYALNSKNMQIVFSHRLHATAGSLLSLICYVHKATVFHDYIESIVESRAINAPHLNPPVKKRYNYAQHHILWNKPELFFEDWKVRYGLWRCFRNKKKDVYFIKDERERSESFKRKSIRRHSFTTK